GPTDLVLRPFAFGDVFDRAFVIQQVALGIAYRAAILGDPDDRFFLAIDLRFERRDGVVLLHDADEFIAPAGIDVQFAGDIGDTGHQFRGRIVTIDAG